MEHQFKNIKRSIKNNAFKELTFSEKMKQNIFKEIEDEEISEEQLLVTVLQLLTTEKTGFELCQLFVSRGIKKFDEKEGYLYTFLHRLEQKGYISARWVTSGPKYYLLSGKGKKVLQKYELKKMSKIAILKELFEG